MYDDDCMGPDDYEQYLDGCLIDDGRGLTPEQLARESELIERYIAACEAERALEGEPAPYTDSDIPF